MKIFFILLFLTLNYGVINAQLEMRSNPYIKGRIIMKDKSVKDGLIQFNSSAFRVRFREDKEQKDKEKIDYKSIEKIVLTSKYSDERVFFYKKTDANKFLKFVELIHQSSKYDVYVNSSNDLSLFYKDVDRSNVNDFLSLGSGIINQPYRSVSQIKDYLKQVKNPKYLLDTKNLDEIQFIHSNRRLRKDAKKFFKGCPELLRKIDDKELKTDDIIEIVELYNSCNENDEN